VPAPALARRSGGVIGQSGTVVGRCLRSESVTDVGGDEPSFVWEVGQDLIDLDHWAQTYTALRVEEKESERSAFFRYGYWPIMALVVIVIGATSSVGMAVALAVVLVAVFGGAKLWNRSAATRLAERLHNLPAASEPFTFRAGPSGTHSASESGSENLSWSRYKSAHVFDDLVVLTHDTNVMRLLPIRALTAGQQASGAVDKIGGWIEIARSTSAPAS
jgi:hypothetical protein